MKAKTQLYVIIFLCAALAANCIVIFSQQKTIRRFERAPSEMGKIRVENTLLKEGFFHTYDFEGTTIDYSAYVTDMDGKAFKLQELFSDKSRLVVFMSVGSCRDCIYNNIEFIKEHKNQGNIIVGIDGLTRKEFKSFVNQYELEDIAYLLPENFFTGFQINPVIYFVVDKDLNCQYFYAPSTVFPDLTKNYWEVVKNRLAN